jgi:hypothetical protein
MIKLRDPLDPRIEMQLFKLHGPLNDSTDKQGTKSP